MDSPWPPEVMREGHIVTNLDGFPIAEPMALALEEAKFIINKIANNQSDVFLTYYESENFTQKAWVTQFGGKFYIAISVSKVFYLFKYFIACFGRSDLMSACPYLPSNPLSSYLEIEGIDAFEAIDNKNQIYNVLRLSIIFIFLHEYSHAELGHLRDGLIHQMSAEEFTKEGYGFPGNLTDRAVAELMADRYAGRTYANYILNAITELPFSGKVKSLYIAFISIQLLFESYSRGDKWLNEYADRQYPPPQLGSISALSGVGEVMDGYVDSVILLTVMSSGVEAGIKISSWLYGVTPTQRDGDDYAILAKNISNLSPEIIQRHREIYGI